MNKVLPAFLALILYIPSLYASDGVYAGLQYARVTLPDDSGEVGDAHPGAAVFRYGSQVDEHVGFEGRLAIGVSADTVTIRDYYYGFEVDVDIDVDSLVGFYAVLSSGFESDTSIYGVIGFSDMEIEVTVDGSPVSSSESGVSFGLGVKFDSFTIEYMSYLDEADAEASAISLGFVNYF